MFLFAQWRHAFKLDPARLISDRNLERICLSGTDAIIVGGSSDVTFENTVELLERIRRYELDVALEISNPAAAVPGFDHYFVPLVLNSRRVEWLIGNQIAALKQLGRIVPWEQTSAVGYIIMNPEATAAKVSQANTALTETDLEAYMYMAEKLLRLPSVYLEYSGTYGEHDLLWQLHYTKEQTHLFYGGGIKTLEQAQQMARYANTVVVGNVIYEDLEAALDTVKVTDRTMYEPRVTRQERSLPQ